MSRGVLAVVGLILFLGAVVLALILRGPSPPFTGESAASGVAPAPAPKADAPITKEPPPPTCALEDVRTSKARTTEGEPIELTVSLATDDQNWCRDTIALDAPNFKTSSNRSSVTIPPLGSLTDEESEEIADDARSTQDFVWILAPEKPGAHKVAVSTSTDYKVLDIAVGDAIGLNPFWAQLLSGAGVVLGPVLTVPWWLDRWRERKKGGSEREAYGEGPKE